MDKRNLTITEAKNPCTTDIDTLSSMEILRLINEEDTKVPLAVRQELPQIAQAVDVISERLRHGGRLLYFGAGTSGRIGVLDASEIPPTYGTHPSMVQGFIAGGDTALRESIEAAEDNPMAGAQIVRDVNVDAEDVAVGIAASGSTPWVHGAIKEARTRGAFTVALTCNPNTPLTRIADLVIAPVVGPEVIAGSSRMKAGTAQKLVLNMLSTAAMIQMGKVYKNFMVDVVPTNTKLCLRTVRIVQETTGVDEEIARGTLEQTGYAIKPTLVMLLAGVDYPEAQRRLAETEGFVRRAIEM